MSGNASIGCSFKEDAIISKPVFSAAKIAETIDIASLIDST